MAARQLSLLVILLATGGLGAAMGAAGRWYTTEQVESGRQLYVAHCAACHGAGGEGQPHWEDRDPDTGYYPAPPLNDAGHAADHPKLEMLRVLDQGGGPFGGTMPSFVDVLEQRQKEAVIAYVQSLWPDDTYARWLDVEAGRSRASADGSHQH